VALAATACGDGSADGLVTGDGAGAEAISEAESTLHTSQTVVGDWAGLPDGTECVPGARSFFETRFGASFPRMPAHATGSCPPLGACHLWLDAEPDPGTWERFDAGAGVPQTYDLIVYPPHGNGLGKYGHVAIVDHVEGDHVYVMDVNYVGHHRRSPLPHEVDWAAEGWYRLRTLPPSGCVTETDRLEDGAVPADEPFGTGTAPEIWVCRGVLKRNLDGTWTCIGHSDVPQSPLPPPQVCWGSQPVG
jgi:hypothetical protein